MAFYPFFVIAGLWMGVLFATTQFPATVWTIQLSRSHGLWTGLAAALGLAFAHGAWALPGLGAVMSLGPWIQWVDVPLRGIICGVYLWMGLRVWRTPPVTELDYAGPPEDHQAAFGYTLRRAVRMPWRLLALAGLAVVVSLHVRSPGPGNAALMSLGVLLGTFGWWALFATMARYTRKSVPVAITLKSVNKLRRLGAIVFLGLSLLSIAPLAVML